MAALDLSTETKELAWELSQEKPDTHRIEWLLQDCQADLSAALKQAKIKEEFLTKSPTLRPLQLQKRLRHP